MTGKVKGSRGKMILLRHAVCAMGTGAIFPLPVGEWVVS